MKRKLEAVIFDMDGVIVDTFELYYIANKRIADYLEVPFTREENERFRGIGRTEIIETLVSESGKLLAEEEKIALADSKNVHYQKLLSGMDEKFIMPGMEGFLVNLKENQVKIALASSSTNSRRVLERLGLYDYFEYIVDPQKLKKGKPDPEIFLKAAFALGVDEGNCVAIEDGEAGMKAIKATRMFSIGIGDSTEVRKADWQLTETKDIDYEELLKRFEECKHAKG